MTRRTLLVLAATLLLAGGALLAFGRAGSGDPDPSGSPSAIPTSPASGEPSPSVGLFPAPPADPTDSCALFRAIVASKDDLISFGELLLDGADRELAADAALAYAAAADDWDELAIELIARYPGALDPQSAAYAVEAIKYGATVPQAVDYLAKVIRGEATDQTIEEAAAAFATPGSYSTLDPMLGFESSLCGE
jgi:hypothetical protein